MRSFISKWFGVFTEIDEGVEKNEKH